MAREQNGEKVIGRQPPAASTDGQLPLYEWAFDDRGQPVPIEQARRGVEYRCPLCGGRMIARQGEIKQHHYAHDEETNCPPEAVAQAAAARWIALRMQDCLARHQAVLITWPCHLCEQPHTANLLEGVVEIHEGHTWHDWTADLALLDVHGQPRTIIALAPPAPDALQAYTACSITTLSVVPDRLRGQPFDLARLLTGATIHGGTCTTQQAIARQGIVTDIQTLRTLLGTAVLHPPFYAYGPLETHAGVTNILTLGDRKLWLPPVLWQRAIGGLLHTVRPGVQIITQEWPQDDGSTIALYYITVKEASAVAVRRFAPGEPVQAQLATTSLRAPEAAALQIAAGFAHP